MPTISVIVPVYNVEKYLLQCLESIKSQTFGDFEVICVNDGSKDSSLDILRSVSSSDSRFTIIDKANGGYGAAINSGIAKASGKYIAIVESDDFVDSRMFEVLVNAAEENDLDIVRANYWLYWSTPEVRNEYFEAYSQDKCGVVFDPLSQKECFYYPPALWAMLIRRDVIVDNELKLLETPGAAYQDTAFSFKLWACSKRAMLLFDAFLHYRQDNENSSINQKDKAYLVCGEYAEISRYILHNDNKDALFPIAEKRKFDAYEWNLQRIDDSLRLDFAKAVSEEFQGDRDKGWLSQSTFDDRAWTRVNALMSDPERFLVDFGKKDPCRHSVIEKIRGFFGKNHQ